jgi:hypothetical protein
MSDERRLRCSYAVRAYLNASELRGINRINLFLATASIIIQSDLGFATEPLVIICRIAGESRRHHYERKLRGDARSQSLRSLPISAQNVAPQLQDLDYILVEEEIALVAIVAVLPRWRNP